MIKRSVLIFLIMVIMLINTGCYDSKEVDQLAYVVAVGLDKGEKNGIKMTLMFAVPVSIGAGAQEAGKTEEASAVTTIEAPTIYAGINMVNTYIAKQVSFSHTKAFIFSEELAKEGISEQINVLIKSREFRPNMFIGVSRGTAQKYINSIKPVMEVNPAKYIELIHEAYHYTGFTANSRLEDLNLQIKSNSIQPVAALVGVNELEKSQEFKNINAATAQNPEKPFEGEFIAGELPFLFKNHANVMGLAVFDGDKMVGVLNGQDTMYYLMLTGQYRFSNISFPDAKKLDEYVTINISQARSPKIKAVMSGDKPIIDIKLYLEGDLISMYSNYSDQEEIKTLEDSIAAFIENDVKRFLLMTAEVFHSDICGTGNSIKNTFFYWDDWEAFNWLNKYSDADFNLKVRLQIRRTGLTLRQVTPYSSGRE